MRSNHSASIFHPKSSGAAIDEPVLIVFGHLSVVALGTATGLVFAVWILFATAVLLLKGGFPVGPTLALLAQYFPGYSVTWPGTLIGALYGFVVGFIFGSVFASMRNAFLFTYIQWVRRRAQQSAMSDLP